MQNFYSTQTTLTFLIAGAFVCAQRESPTEMLQGPQKDVRRLHHQYSKRGGHLFKETLEEIHS